jgi:hypothetical protein
MDNGQWTMSNENGAAKSAMVCARRTKKWRSRLRRISGPADLRLCALLCEARYAGRRRASASRRRGVRYGASETLREKRPATGGRDRQSDIRQQTTPYPEEQETPLLGVLEPLWLNTSPQDTKAPHAFGWRGSYAANIIRSFSRRSGHIDRMSAHCGLICSRRIR